MKSLRFVFILQLDQVEWIKIETEQMFEDQIPFQYIFLSGDTLPLFPDGRIISTFNKCGIFFCRRGMVEVSLEDKHFQITPGDIYIYMASTLVHLLHKSEDAEGVMVEVDLEYIIPIVNKVMNVENQLFMREHPCISLSKDQCAHLEYLLANLWERIKTEGSREGNASYRQLKLELIKSMGQTLCYEVLSMYFTNQPLRPLAQSKKDVVFQNFMLALFRFCRKERDVSFYAGMQHITPRYFSTIIKEKSGNSALQWIVQMVITEAKQLLEGSDLSIKEIADQLNFPTQSFFGKYFKQYVGISPKEYRKNKQKINTTT